MHGGVPQGSILGVFLFNVAVDGRVALKGGYPPGWTGKTGHKMQSKAVEAQSPRGRRGAIGEEQVASPPTMTTCVEAATPGISPIHHGGLYPGEGTEFEFLARVRNIRRGSWSREEEVPPEPNPRTLSKWKPEDIQMFEYIDDYLQVEKNNIETAIHLSLIHI